jgi:hypothetical protein
MERNREARRKWHRKYRAKPSVLAMERARDAVRRTRMVAVGGKHIYFPTVELKEQAVDLIRRSRDVFKQRQQGRAQGQTHATDAV